MVQNRVIGYGQGPAAIQLAPSPFLTQKTLGTADYFYGIGQLAYEIPKNNWAIYSDNGLWRNLATTVQATRDPSSTDNTYAIGTTWSNTSTNNFWGLTSYTGTSAQWESLTVETTGTIATLTGNDSNQILPDVNGNVNILGGSSGFLTTVRTSASSLTVKESGILGALYGGTGSNTLTANGVMVAQGSSTVHATSAGSSGQPLLAGGLGTDPNWGTLSVSFGGTGDTNLTAHSVLVGAGTSSITQLSAGATGTLLVGSSGADPAFATSANGNFSFTSSTAGSIRTLSITHSDNTNTGSHAAVQLTTGGTNGGNPYITFAVGTTAGYGFGINNTGTTGQPLYLTYSNAGVIGPGAGTILMTVSTSGIVSFPANPLGVASGGTGLNVQNPYALLCGGTTTTAACVSLPANGSSGQVLTSNGALALPTWQGGGGNWTPGIAFGGSATGITYSTQAGEYTQIGNVVYFNFIVNLSSKGVQVGTATITGFPVSASGTATEVMLTSSTNLTVPLGTTGVSVSTSGATTAFTLRSETTGSGSTNLTNIAFANNTRLSGVGFYFTS